MKKLVRNIMMLCTGLCFAKLMMFLHPFVAMIPNQWVEGEDPVPVYIMWFFMGVFCFLIVVLSHFIRWILASIYGWVFE